MNQGIVDGYRAANIPLECMWNDLDIYRLYRDFTNNPATFPATGMRDFIAGLHANGQYYIPIVDANIYVPNPADESDAYGPWTRGAELGLFIRQAETGEFYYGDNWPGFSSWVGDSLPSQVPWGIY